MSRLRTVHFGRFWHRLALGVPCVLVTSIALSIPTPAAGQQTSAAPAITEARTEAAAIVAAKSSGHRVEVASARSEVAQVFAEPSGRLTYEAAVLPQRARRADGSWAEVDLNLRRGPDGFWRPAVSVADVRFSNGGNGPAVTLVRSGKAMTMSWPSRLPTPVVSGDSLTYPDVLSGVDLVLRATRTGFTHVLVVKNAAAAANPALRQVRFAIGGDAKLRSMADGSLRAMAGSTVLARSGPAVMWDSNDEVVVSDVLSSRGLQMAPSKAATRSSAVSAGDVARISRLGVEVDSAGDLLLTPDAAHLVGAGAKYPMFIDPSWDNNNTAPPWAYSNSNNANNETSVARVGMSPGQGYVYRSYFQFPLGPMSGKYIHSAYVHMRLTHSSSCSDEPTYMYHTAGITGTPRTAWSTGLGGGSYLSSALSHANELGNACAAQPDVDVNFLGDPVRDVIRTHAANGWQQITLGLSAAHTNQGAGESIEARWKKFLPDDARLVIDYDSKPGVPTGLHVGSIGSTVACPISGRLSIGTLSPVLSAVYPDADGTQTLAGTYEWLEIPASGTYDASTPRKPAPAPASATANGRATTSALSGLQLTKAYAFRVKSKDPSPYNQESDWSPWCEFAPDTQVPLKPTITPVALPAKPGLEGTFTFTAAPTDTDVNRFWYGWSNPPTTEVAATGTTTKTATVKVTAPKFGQNVLWVTAIDEVGNVGNHASHEFTVGRPTPPIATWGLESYPGVTTAQALADGQPALGGNTPLTQTGLSWAADARLVGGQTAAVGGSTRVSTTSGVVDTTKSFSVAAWYRMTTPGDFHAVVSQEGDATSGFILAYYAPWSTWNFYMYDTDSTSTAGAVAYALSAASEWTHVAAVYDAAAHEMRLYINGGLAATTPRNQTWNASGKFQIGSAKWGNGGVMTGQGQVAGVQAFDRVLVADDFTGELASDPTSGGFNEPGIVSPIGVGQWDFNAATPCYEAGIPDTCEAPDATLWSRRLQLTPGSYVDSGHRDNALLLDGTHWAEQGDPHYGEATNEYGVAQTNTTPTGQPTWQDTSVLRTDQSFTVSAWALLPTGVVDHRNVVSQFGNGGSGFYLIYDAWGNRWAFGYGEKPGVPDSNKYVWSAEAPARDTWVHLVGVYDASSRSIKLYVNGQLQGSNSGVTQWNADGPLNIGRFNWRGFIVWPWHGGIDDLQLYQGKMTDAAVKSLYEAQLV